MQKGNELLIKLSKIQEVNVKFYMSYQYREKVEGRRANVAQINRDKIETLKEAFSKNISSHYSSGNHSL